MKIQTAIPRVQPVEVVQVPTFPTADEARAILSWSDQRLGCEQRVEGGKRKHIISYQVYPNDSSIGSYAVEVNGLFVIKKGTGSFSILGTEEFHARYEFAKL